MMAKVKVLPIFIVRVGHRRYRVICKEPFEVKRVSRDREACLEMGMEQWGAVLDKVVLEYWDQWFVFENAFEAGGRSE